MTKNSEKFLADAIKSVRIQKYRHIEHVIVDGASTDNTIKIIKSLSGENTVWVSESDESMYEAINKGVKLSKGEIINILNSDDYFASPDSVGFAVAALYKAKSDAVYSDLIIDTDGALHRRRTFQTTYLQHLSFEKGTLIPHPTLFMRKTSLLQLGGYDQSYRFASDYDLILRCLREQPIAYCSEPLTVFRRHENSITATGAILAERRRIIALHRKHAPSSFLFFIAKFIAWGKFLTINLAQKILERRT